MNISRRFTAVLLAIASTAGVAALPSAASAATPTCKANRVCLYIHRDYGGPKRLELNPYAHFSRLGREQRNFHLKEVDGQQWRGQVSSAVNNTGMTFYAYEDGLFWPKQLWKMAPGQQISFVGKAANDRATRISAD